MCIIMEEHYTGCQHSTSFVLNGHTQFFYCFAIHLVMLCSPLLHEFHHQHFFHVLSQKTVASWQADICLNFLGSFGEYVCIHCFDCSLVSAFTNETQVSSSVTHMMWLRNSSPSLWYHSTKVKAEAILCILRTPVSIFGTHLCKTCDSLT
jgi:hypothetical protein